MRNLVNFNASNGKSENFTFMDYFNQKYVNFDIGKMYREK